MVLLYAVYLENLKFCSYCLSYLIDFWLWRCFGTRQPLIWKFSNLLCGLVPDAWPLTLSRPFLHSLPLSDRFFGLSLSFLPCMCPLSVRDVWAPPSERDRFGSTG